MFPTRGCMFHCYFNLFVVAKFTVRFHCFQSDAHHKTRICKSDPLWHIRIF